MRKREKERADRELRNVAYHEAGHAVMHLVERRRFTYVSIEPTGRSLGRVVVSPLSVRRGERLFRDGFIDVGSIRVALAGSSAERRIAGRYNHLGSLYDYGRAIDIARGADESGGGPESAPMVHAVINAATKEVEEIIVRWWPEVEALAVELLTRRRMTFEEVQDFVMAVRRRRQGERGKLASARSHDSARLTDPIRGGGR